MIWSDVQRGLRICLALVVLVGMAAGASGCGGGSPKKDPSQMGPAPNDGLVDLKTLLDAVKAG
ncbi:MAG: hypothetical protein ACOYK7_14995, partial [Pirellulales bacterium]